MKKAIFLSVRNKATRFPGKVLKDFCNGLNVTEYLLSQLKTCKEADIIVIATSTHPDDAVFKTIADTCNVEVFCGSEDDKLLRYKDAAKHYGIDAVAIVDGDDPFCSPRHTDSILSVLEKEKKDYVTYGNLPLGGTSFGLSFQALEKICHERPESDTEVWGHLFAHHPDIFKVKELSENDTVYAKPDIRLTLDYAEDYDFFQKMITMLKNKNLSVCFDHCMHLLQEESYLATMNQTAKLKYEENMKKLKEKQTCAF